MSATGGETSGPSPKRAERLASLFNRHEDCLKSFTIRVLGEHGESDTAEDILQDTWVKLVESERELPSDDEEAVSAIYGVVKGVARNRRRYEAVRSGELLEEADGVRASPSHEGAVMAKIEVSWALKALTPAERETVVFRELEGCTLREIAERRGCAKYTAKTLLQRGRRWLRKRISTGSSKS